MESQGYSGQQVTEAISQIGIKSSIESNTFSQNELQPSLIDEDIPVPTPPQADTQYEIQRPVQQPQFAKFEPQVPSINLGQIDMQELIESVVDERWQRFSDSMTDFEIWKSRISDDMISVKQEIIRLNNRFDILQKSVLGKVDEYNKNISDVNSEMKALEKVFQNIINPLTSNIKELARITKDLKEK